MIIKLILQLKNSKEVCSAMMLCSDNEALYRPVRSAQVGTNKCTYGPGYWCEKLENAQECGSGVRISNVLWFYFIHFLKW